MKVLTKYHLTTIQDTNDLITRSSVGFYLQQLCGRVSEFIFSDGVSGTRQPYLAELILKSDAH